MKNELNVYEGNEPYVFVSYAHKDTDIVLPIVDKMMQAGYRIWFDDGIAPGSEWPEYIAQHLGNSALLIAFISPRYMESNNCKREITYGLSKNIPFLGIILEPTKMSMGMEMQLSSQQCVLKYNFNREERFIEKICSTPDLQSCKKQEEISAEVATSVEEIAENRESDTTSKQVKTNSVKEKAPKEPKEKSTGKILRGLLIAVAIFVFVCIFGVAAVLFGNRKVKITDQYSVSKNTGYISITSEKLTKQTIKNIGKMDKAFCLKFVDADCSEVDFSELKNKDQIETIIFENCTGITNFSFLKDFTKLREITITNCPELTGFDVILGEENKNSIRSINVSNTSISNLNPLAEASGLKEIVMDGCPVNNIDALANLEDLRAISFKGCQIEAVNEKFQSLRLEEIYLGYNPVTELSGFDNCTVLTTVDLSNTSLKEVPVCVLNNAAAIRYLNVSNTEAQSNGETGAQILEKVLGSSADISTVLASGVKLENNELWNQLLAGKESLVRLNLSNCGIEGGLSLASCGMLKNVDLSDNNISEIQLANNMQDTINFVDLSSNSLINLTGLKDTGVKINYLSVRGNKNAVKDLLDEYAVNCSYLYMDYDDSILQLDKEKTKNIVDMYVYNVPENKVVSVEDSNLHFRIGDEEKYEKEWAENKTIWR